MANVIKCPACGENNLPGQEFCQYCQARLQPLTGNLKGADAPLKPGQFPTKKDTGELEPILPEWLRNARSSARQTSQEEAAQADQQPQQGYRPASSGGDLLAGLHSQAQDNDEEDTPDWLTNITGEAPKAKKSQTESSDVRWVELGAANDFAQSEPVPDDDTPAWLKGISPITPQSGEKDELSDWLRGASDSQEPLQPSQPISFESQSSAPSDAGTQDWLHSMAADDGAFNDSENVVDEPFVSSDTPDWLRAMAADNDAQNVTPPSNNAGIPPISGDTPDWLRTMAAENDLPLTPGIPPASSDTPDWLRTMAAETDATPSKAGGAPPISSDTPDWLRTMDAGNDVPLSTPGMPPVASNIPDWLSAMDAEDAAQNINAPSSNADTSPASSETPDWLSAMDAPEKTQSADSAGFSETGMGESAAVFSSAGDTPDWLKGFETSASSSDQDWLKELPPAESEKPAQDSAPAWLSAAPSFTPEQVQTLPTPEKEDEADVPNWLKPSAPSSVPAPEKDDSALDIPSWLKAAAPQSSIYDEPAGEQEMPAPASSSDSSDWLNAFKSVDLPEAQAVPAFSKEMPLDLTPPVFADDAKPDAKPGANEDALFTDMPSWLSVVDESVSPESVPAPITNTDAIAPGDLPSWVQAMRPVDAGVPQPSSTPLSSDKKLEASGALAGLQGVLPAVKGFAPTSKPKAYSIKMRASDEQQAHAALLEQILAAETEPVPIGSFSSIGTSRGLRWLLVFLFFAALTAVLFMRTQMFSMPAGLPVEVEGALIVAQSIPESAPVLVVFDYEPARVGEMEAAAAPVFDQMIQLHHPRLTFISTNETGAILAERFISEGPLAGHSYQSGVDYLSLGYLPGGQMGVRAFVENPSVTAPYAFAQSSKLFDYTLTPAWGLPPLQGVTSLSQFAAVIVITDNADSARAWIEQTTSSRGAVPFVVISSAQAAPMIHPYYASQQINGLVSGLYGGALFEQNNAGRPGTARAYWDAYSIGMMLVVVLILVGGLLNLALGLRDRAAAREAK